MNCCYKDEITKQVAKVEIDFNDHARFLEKMVIENIAETLNGKKAASTTPKGLVTDGEFDKNKILAKPITELFALKIADKEIMLQKKIPYELHSRGCQFKKQKKTEKSSRKGQNFNKKKQKKQVKLSTTRINDIKD